MCSRVHCCTSNSSVAREATGTGGKEGAETTDQPREPEPQPSQPRTLNDFGSDFRRQVCLGLWPVAVLHMPLVLECLTSLLTACRCNAYLHRLSCKLPRNAQSVQTYLRTRHSNTACGAHSAMQSRRLPFFSLTTTTEMEDTRVLSDACRPLLFLQTVFHYLILANRCKYGTWIAILD